jgi:hypothetical protein
MQNSKTLIFLYTIQQNEYASELNFASDIILANKSSILRKSDNPSTAANTSLVEMIQKFNLSHHIVINTDVPILDSEYGLRSSHAQGTYFMGEDIYITIRYNKPIIVTAFAGALNLLFTTGIPTHVQDTLIGYAQYVSVLDDDQTVQFLYTVAQNTNRTNMDIIPGGNALTISNNGASIKRMSTHPTTDANRNTTFLLLSNHSLSETSKISLNGYLPFVQSVPFLSASSSTNDYYLHPDDSVLFAVVFTGKVQFTCSPVILMNVGFTREAKYVSGNKTNTLIFKYVVSVGDVSSGIYYQYLPNAFCYQSGCVASTACTLVASSTHPSLRGDPGLPTTAGTLSQGLYVFATQLQVLKCFVCTKGFHLLDRTCQNSLFLQLPSETRQSCQFIPAQKQGPTVLGKLFTSLSNSTMR